MFSFLLYAFLGGLMLMTFSIFIYFKLLYTYWKKRKIHYLEPTIPWGTMDNYMKHRTPLCETIVRQYREAKQLGYKYVGLFLATRPVFMPLDPCLIRHMLSTDFRYFVDRGAYVNEKHDPLSAHLFSIEGNRWKNLRMKIAPAFTAGRIKMMYQIFRKCADQLHGAVERICITNEPVDIKDIVARFSTNVVVSCAFGLDCNTFDSGDSEMRKFGKTAAKIHIIKCLLVLIFPDFAKFLELRVVPKNAADFFIQVIRDTVKNRETSNIVRNDLMQILINLKNGIDVGDHFNDGDKLNHDGKRLTMEELASQAFIFFLGGFETSSVTMSFCLYELSINQDVQERARREIHDVLNLHGYELTFEAIHKMKYLGQVVEETLRKYPPIPMLNRKCNADYQIPGTDIILEKETPVFIPIQGLHNDPEYFPNPEEFDPDRFNEENRDGITPFTYMPFGEGPRICIGIRFGQVQTKLGLAVLLQHYKFSLNNKTQIPLKMDPASIIISTIGDIWLNAEKV